MAWRPEPHCISRKVHLQRSCGRLGLSRGPWRNAGSRLEWYCTVDGESIVALVGPQSADGLLCMYVLACTTLSQRPQGGRALIRHVGESVRFNTASMTIQCPYRMHASDGIPASALKMQHVLSRPPPTAANAQPQVWVCKGPHRGLVPKRRAIRNCLPDRVSAQTRRVEPSIDSRMAHGNAHSPQRRAHTGHGKQSSSATEVCFAVHFCRCCRCCCSYH